MQESVAEDDHEPGSGSNPKRNVSRTNGDRNRNEGGKDKGIWSGIHACMPALNECFNQLPMVTVSALSLAGMYFCLALARQLATSCSKG